MLNQYHASFQPSEDSGQYRCTARNERGEVSLAMSLEVNTDIAVGELHSVVLFGLTKGTVPGAGSGTAAFAVEIWCASGAMQQGCVIALLTCGGCQGWWLTSA